MKNYFKEVYVIEKELILKAFKQKDLTTMALILLWFIGFITAISVLVLTRIYPDKAINLFSAFAILLSAFMASVAMMKSISNTNKINVQANKEKKEQSKTQLKFYTKILLNAMNNSLDIGTNNCVELIKKALLDRSFIANIDEDKLIKLDDIVIETAGLLNMQNGIKEDTKILHELQSTILSPNRIPIQVSKKITICTQRIEHYEKELSSELHRIIEQIKKFKKEIA